MNTHNRFNHTVLFSFTIAAFFAFFLYMGMAEQVTVYQAEQTHSYQTLTDLNLEIILDDTAPAGIRKVYRGILVPELSQESCLCFNIAHHSIQVYFDDVLVYSLTGSQSNHIGRNVSSNWCSVHVGQAHAGESVTVVLTPIFQAAIGKNPEFLLGSHYAIVIDILLGELPLLILSAMCILLGLFIFAVFLYFHYFAKNKPMA